MNIPKLYPNPSCFWDDTPAKQRGTPLQRVAILFAADVGSKEELILRGASLWVDELAKWLAEGGVDAALKAEERADDAEERVDDAEAVAEDAEERAEEAASAKLNAEARAAKAEEKASALEQELATVRAARPEELRLAREHADTPTAAWNQQWRLADAHRNLLIELLRRLRANHPNNGISVGQMTPGRETQALWAEVDRELSFLPNAALTDDTLRNLWVGAGGSLDGGNTIVGLMPEARLLPFLRGLVNREIVMGEQETRL